MDFATSIVSDVWCKSANSAEKKILEIKEDVEEELGIKIPIAIRKYGEEIKENPFGFLSPVLEVQMHNTEGFLQLIESDFPIKNGDPQKVVKKFSQVVKTLGEVIKEIT